MNHIERLLPAIDPALAAHCERAGALAGDIAAFMGLGQERIDTLDVAARLHDIGKVFIPRAILDKPGPLDEAEWEELRRHPVMGYELVDAIAPDIVAEIVFTHHERFDGTGYPRGLQGRRIPLEARILQAADAIDAITSERPYQPALPLRYALNELIRWSSSQFDPVVVEAVLEMDQHDHWANLVTEPAVA